jgi:hypothetical protein
MKPIMRIRKMLRIPNPKKGVPDLPGLEKPPSYTNNR